MSMGFFPGLQPSIYEIASETTLEDFNKSGIVWQTQREKVIMNFSNWPACMNEYQGIRFVADCRSMPPMSGHSHVEKHETCPNS
jgi:hypothetical protein